MRGIVLLFSLHWKGPAQGATGPDRWLSSDKARHFFMSAFVQSASFSAIRATGVSRNASLAGATAVSAGVGIGKELYDRKVGGDPSWKDLGADGAGILAATTLLVRTPK
jgi:putative lipoprotein